MLYVVLNWVFKFKVLIDICILLNEINNNYVLCCLVWDEEMYLIFFVCIFVYFLFED